MKKTNVNNAYKLLTAFLTLEAAQCPGSNHEFKINEILAKAERIRKAD